MAKWSLKNRDKAEQQTPPEMPPAAESYYASEKRDRRWGVWLLGLATLLVTAALAFLLFLGGRWVYQQFTDDDTETTTTTQTDSEAPGGVTDEDITDEPTGNDTNGTADDVQTGGSTDSDGTIAGGQTGETEPGGVVSDQAASTDLPNTGPADTALIFIAATIGATLLHRAIKPVK